MTDVLKVEDCEVGAIYRVRAKNFGVAIFTGKGFLGPREKMGRYYLFEEFPWEDGPPYGTVNAVERIGPNIVPAPWLNNEQILALLLALDEMETKLYHQNLVEPPADEIHTESR